MPRTGRKWIALVAGPFAFAALLGVDSPLSAWGDYGARPALAAGLTLWMAIWWISEALPIQWTACVPLLVLPFSNVHGAGFAANLRGALLPYLDPYIFLFLGGMGIATAMQQWNGSGYLTIPLMVRTGVPLDAAAALLAALWCWIAVPLFL